ncbi:MAG: serine hydrolase domain-containing protein, partial [Solirubrobacteraceae bacterium]
LRSGLSDRSTGQPIVGDPFVRIGSVSKTYLAVAVLQAAQRGQLALGDTLAKWLPGVLPKLDEPAITIRMLLDHTSGVPDPTPELLRHPRRFGPAPVTPATLVADARGLAPTAAPGVAFSYSNTDYWLLAMILKRATHRDYITQIADDELHPLRLHHTVLPHDTTQMPRPDLHGYALRPGRPPLDVTAFNASWGSSSGGMIATAGDLAQYAHALLGGRLLAPGTLVEMERGGTPVPANPIGASDYGLGLVTLRLECGTTLYGNMGGLSGYTTWMLSTLHGTQQIVVEANTNELPRIDAAIRSVVQAAFCAR